MSSAPPADWRWARRFELRVYFHAFVARLYFYLPVVVLHMERELGRAGVLQPRALSLSLIAFISIGMLVAEYPSGVLADWLGRKPALILSGLLQAGGVLLFLVPASLWSIAAAQLCVGVATAFRSGADTALLHGHLEGIGQAQRYGRALARLRFCNVVAIALASASGGLLYAWHPASVFVLSALACVLGLASLVGLREAPTTDRRRGYRQVLRESLEEIRDNGRARALMLLGGVGNTYFVFCYFAMQTFFIDSEVGLGWMGMTVSAVSFLQAATMPVSGWLSGDDRYLARTFETILLAVPAAILGVSLAWSTRQTTLGAALLVGIGGCHVLYRNAVNVQLQHLVRNAVRSSIVSLEAWIGSLYYAVLFPVGGWAFATYGTGRGFLMLSLLMVVTVLPLLLKARRIGATGTSPAA